jgi:hypothetical protein
MIRAMGKTTIGFFNATTSWQCKSAGLQESSILANINADASQALHGESGRSLRAKAFFY